MATTQSMYFDENMSEAGKKAVADAMKSFCEEPGNENFTYCVSGVMNKETQIMPSVTGMSIYAANLYDFMNDAGFKLMQKVSNSLKEQGLDDKFKATHYYDGHRRSDYDIDQTGVTLGSMYDEEDEFEPLYIPEEDEFEDIFKHYKGQFGEFDYDPRFTDVNIDEDAVLEGTEFNGSGYYVSHENEREREDYIEKMFIKVQDDPMKYDHLIESFDFGKKPIPEGYTGPRIEPKVEMVHYKGQYGEFDFDPKSTVVDIDDNLLFEDTEFNDSNFLQYPENERAREERFEDVWYEAQSNPTEYDGYISSFDFGKNPIPEGYTGPRRQITDEAAMHANDSITCKKDDVLSHLKVGDSLEYYDGEAGYTMCVESIDPATKAISGRMLNMWTPYDNYGVQNSLYVGTPATIELDKLDLDAADDFTITPMNDLDKADLENGIFNREAMKQLMPHIHTNDKSHGGVIYAYNFDFGGPEYFMKVNKADFSMSVKDPEGLPFCSESGFVVGYDDEPVDKIREYANKATNDYFSASGNVYGDTRLTISFPTKPDMATTVGDFLKQSFDDHSVEKHIQDFLKDRQPILSVQNNQPSKRNAMLNRIQNMAAQAKDNKGVGVNGPKGPGKS